MATKKTDHVKAKKRHEAEATVGAKYGQRTVLEEQMIQLRREKTRGQKEQNDRREGKKQKKKEEQTPQRRRQETRSCLGTTGTESGR